MANREVRTNGLRTKTKYMVPNGITALSLVLGLISMYFSHVGNFTTAGWVILYSTVLDKLDGSTARVLNASSEFGGQLDSFSDFVAFGIAPAFLVFAICNGDPAVAVYFEAKEPPLFLYLSLIFFVLVSAMRLARFNVSSVEDFPYMFGLATTASGGLIAAYVLTCYQHHEFAFFIKLLQWLPYVLLILGAFEISNLPMSKIGYKKTRLGKTVELGILIIALFCIFTRTFPEFLLITGIGYSALGFIQGYRCRGQIQEAMRKATGSDNECGEKT